MKWVPSLRTFSDTPDILSKMTARCPPSTENLQRIGISGVSSNTGLQASKTAYKNQLVMQKMLTRIHQIQCAGTFLTKDVERKYNN